MNMSGPLSQDLKYKVIDASATTTSFNAQVSTNHQSSHHKRKNSILISSGPTNNLKLKGSSGGYRVSNVRMSPLNKFLKDAIPVTASSKPKRTSAKH